jgi:hypothetical protein
MGTEMVFSKSHRDIENIHGRPLASRNIFGEAGLAIMELQLQRFEAWPIGYCSVVPESLWIVTEQSMNKPQKNVTDNMAS